MAASGSQHRGSRVLFGRGARNCDSVDLRSSLKPCRAVTASCSPPSQKNWAQVRFQTVEEVKVISLQKLAASCGVWRQPATLQLFSKPSGHQARRVEGPGKMKAPGLTEAFKGGQRVHLGVDVA